MKKIGLAVFVACGLLVVGCNNKDVQKYEDVMKDYATQFYNLRLKGTEGLTTTTISIKQLKRDIEVAGGSYDMTKLANCDDSSYVELKIDQTNNSISSYTFHMECK